MTTTIRTRIIADAADSSRCTLRTHDEDGELVTREFFVSLPSSGLGYVREWVSGGRDARQVCEGLSDAGATLMFGPCPQYPTLAHLIRAEHRRAQRARAAETRRWGW